MTFHEEWEAEDRRIYGGFFFTVFLFTIQIIIVATMMEYGLK